MLHTLRCRSMAHCSFEQVCSHEDVSMTSLIRKSVQLFSMTRILMTLDESVENGLREEFWHYDLGGRDNEERQTWGKLELASYIYRGGVRVTTGRGITRTH